MHLGVLTVACWHPESILQYNSNSAASPHTVDKSQTSKSCRSGLSLQEKEAREAAGATKKNWLLSEQTLDKQVVQGMDFTRNLALRQHLFLEVCCMPAVPSFSFSFSVIVTISISLLMVVLNEFELKLPWPGSLSLEAASIRNSASGSCIASVMVFGVPKEHPSAEGLQISL